MNETFSQNFLFKSQEWEETDKWVKVKGIASDDSTRDLQGELIKVSGADLSYAGISSMLAWEHGGEKDASVYIGPIDKAYREGTKLIIEGRIMKNLEQGRKVIDLMKAMKDMGREMQLSVEGKVTKRNPIDKKIIDRWKFTHCALTLLPQNRKTSLFFSKSENKDAHIFDHTDPKTGKRVIVKSDKSIEIIEKTITAENIETKKEDLEKKPKHLTKSEVINYIIGKFETQDDLNKSEQIFNFIERVRAQNFNKMAEITEEVIDKAVEILEKSQKELEDLKKSEASKEEGEKKEGEKSETEEKKEEKVEKSEASEEKEEKVEKSEVKKAEDEKEEEKEEKEEEVEKSFQEGHQDEQKMGYDEVMKAMKGMGKEDVKKMYGAMKKMMGDDMKKSETEEKKEEKVEKSEASEEKEEIKKSEAPSLYEKMAEVINGNSDLKKSFLAMEARLGKIEDTPIQKSVDSAGYVERFDKSENKEQEGKNELSASKNKKEVSDAILDASGIKKGENVDHTMLKAVQVFEATGKIDDKIVKSLAEDHNVFIKE